MCLNKDKSDIFTLKKDIIFKAQVKFKHGKTIKNRDRYQLQPNPYFIERLVLVIVITV